jgi:hypothetical protein
LPSSPAGLFAVRSKAEMVKHMEKMFDRMDTKKMGKLDKKQTEEFLKQLTAPSGS